MCPTCALSYAARVGIRANPSDPRHAAREGACVRPLLQPAVVLQGRCHAGARSPHRQVGAFFRGVILIGALCKVLRLPLLQESGRLRQNQRDYGLTRGCYLTLVTFGVYLSQGVTGTCRSSQSYPLRRQAPGDESPRPRTGRQKGIRDKGS